MKNNPFHRHASCALACSVAVLLGACGGGGGGGGANETTVAASLNVQSTPGQSQAAGGDAAAPASSAPDATPAPSPAVSSTPSPAPTPAPAPTPSPAPAAAAIDYYGDSTVWGYKSGVGSQVANPAPSVFAAALPQYRLGTQYTVRNEGVNATTACQLLNGTDGKHPAWDTQMGRTDASIVIINHGINDEWKESLDEYKGCLAALAQKGKAHGKTVIFETPNPTRDSYPNGLDKWVDAMRAVAAQQGVAVIDQYAYLKSYLNGASPLTICPDGLHPNEAVYAMKGKYAASVFAKLPR